VTGKQIREWRPSLSTLLVLAAVAEIPLFVALRDRLNWSGFQAGFVAVGGLLGLAFLLDVRRVKFSLRFMFALVAAAALLLALWRLRPSRHLAVQLTASGTAVVNGAEIKIASMPGMLNREGAWREFWFQDPHLMIQAHPSSRRDAVEGIVEQALQQGGFRMISVTRGDPDAHPNERPVERQTTPRWKGRADGVPKLRR